MHFSILLLLEIVVINKRINININARILKAKYICDLAVNGNVFISLLLLLFTSKTEIYMFAFLISLNTKSFTFFQFLVFKIVSRRTTDYNSCFWGTQHVWMQFWRFLKTAYFFQLSKQFVCWLCCFYCIWIALCYCLVVGFCFCVLWAHVNEIAALLQRVTFAISSIFSFWSWNNASASASSLSSSSWSPSSLSWSPTSSRAVSLKFYLHTLIKICTILEFWTVLIGSQ